jgi:hypothetical protein
MRLCQGLGFSAIISVYARKTLGCRDLKPRGSHLISSDPKTLAGQNHAMATLIHQIFCFSTVCCEISAFDGRAVDEKASHIVTGYLTKKSGKAGDLKHVTDLQCSKRSQKFWWRFTAIVVEHIAFRYDDRASEASQPVHQIYQQKRHH